MTCPGCASAMVEVPLEGHYGHKFAIDLCQACNSVWFDDREDISMAPAAVLRLFEEMGQAASTARAPIGVRKICPRCHTGLFRTVDHTRKTPYEYFRCGQQHGRFMSFASFLRFRHFVRDLTEAEVRALSHTASILKCVNCGASIDVKAHSACPYCQAPVAILDASQLSRTIAELEAERDKPKTIDPTWPIRAAHARRQTEAVFAALHGGDALSEDTDLLEQGLKAFGRVLAEFKRP